MSTLPLTEVRNNTRTIARNSFWYGVEMGFFFIVGLVTSVAMARAIGPEKLGYFNYISWLANMSGQLASLGIPITTRKYMAEYLGKGEGGVARAIFTATLRLQILTASAMAAFGLLAVAFLVPAEYRLYSAFLVASVCPVMIISIPSQANMAAENMRANVLGTIIGASLYAIAVALSLYFHWGVLGIAIGFFVYRSVELWVRLVQAGRWVFRLPKGEIPSDLRRRMRSFSGASIVLLVLNIIVWDRSDAIFLKWLCKDLKQITFYFVAFNLPERVSFLPQVFAGAVGTTIMAQYGRDKSRLREIARGAARYIALLTFPVLIGMTVLSGTIIRLLYGAQYLPAIPVLGIAAAFALPKVFLVTGQQLLQASEKQNFLVVWGCIAASVNILLDLTLIPANQAIGAALANGGAQALSVIGVWVAVMRLLGISLPFRSLLRMGLSSAVMGAAVWCVARPLTPWLAAILAPLAGALVYVVMLRLTASLESTDRQRLSHLRNNVPAAFRGLFDRAIDFVVPDSSPAASRVSAC
jgi:O-antigen/teichoic acid export membrane protein